MRKNTKAILVFLCALVMVLTGIGMPVAHAAGTVDDLTVDYIFSGLGDALKYGVVAEEYVQGNHAETSVCVDKLIKTNELPFLNTETTYMYGQAYPLYATVSAPADKTLQGMKFALFTANGDDYTMVEDTIFTVTEDTNVTAVGWKLPEDSEALKETLYIRQVEERANGTYRIINEGAENSAELKVHYGPSVSTAAPSSSYIGSLVSDINYGSSLKFYNTMKHNPPIQLGEGVRLCAFTQVGYGRWDYVDITDCTQPVYDRQYNNVAAVYIQFTNSAGEKQYERFHDEIFYQWEQFEGKGYIYYENGGTRYKLDITSAPEQPENQPTKVQSMLQDATAMSIALGNMTGGVVKHDETKGAFGSYDPDILGNSTVTGPEDENGNVVSLYNVALNNWAFDEKALQNSIGQQKILIAPNEYAVFNVICPAKDGYVDMLPNSLDMYVYAAGKADQAQWGKEDSGASDRVLFNYVYWDETEQKYLPFEGTINPASQHGGTLLAPSAHLDVLGSPPNGASITKSVENKEGTEIHQRTMTSHAQTSWVNMLGDEIITTGAIKVIKKNGSTMELLDDVEFTVYTDAACTKKLEQDGLTNPAKTGKPHDSNHGFVLFDGLNPGTYYVKETKSKPDYITNDKVYTVKVQAGVTSLVGTKGYVENFKGKGTLELVKAEEGNTSVKLPGAEFALYHCKGKDFKADEATLLGVYTTDANGKIQVRLDASPDYWIVEIKAPFGYELGVVEPKKVEIKKDQTTVVESAAGTGVVTNTKKPLSDLKVTKVDAEDNSIKLQNAEFKVYLDEACKEEVGTFTTDQNGEGTIELPVGTYWVKETKAPTNYNITFDKQQVEIVEGQTALLGTNGVVTNEHVKGEVYVRKVSARLINEWWGSYWESDSVAPLPGAEFTVYNNAACATENIVAVEITDEDGYARFSLKPGQYWVKETRAPAGYEIRTTEAKEFWVQAGDDKRIDGDFYVYQGDQRYNGSFVNTRTETGSIELFKGYKEADGSTTPLYGAEFGIYYDQACTQLISKHVTGDFGRQNPDGSYEHKGGFRVSGFTIGQTYYLKELTPPEGYEALPKDTVLSVTIESTGNNRVHYNGESVVYNEKATEAATVTLPVTKELQAANEFIRLPYDINETFEFAIAADEATAKLTGWEILKDKTAITVEDTYAVTTPVADAFSIKFTEAGTYTFEVKETTPGTGYVKTDKTVYTVVYTVTEDSGKLTATPTIKKGNETADEVAFVNTYGSFSISGEKVWQDADESLRLNIDAGTFKKDYLRIYLYGEENPITDAQMEAWGASLKVNDDLVYDAETGGDVPTGNFVWNYYDLPAYDDDGNALTYVVKELTVKGYQTFYVNNTGTGAQPDGIYEEAPRPAVTDRTYSIYNILADATLTIEKTVEVQGNVQPDTLPEFQFTITPAEGLTGYHVLDEADNELTLPTTVNVKMAKDADGNIVGTLPVTILFDSFVGTEKEFTFTVKETGTAPDGWTYDATEQTVTFTVKRNQSALEPSDSPVMSQPVDVFADSTSGGTASFTNTYKEEEKTSVTVRKHWPTSKGIIVSKYLFLCTLDADGKPVKLNPQPQVKYTEVQLPEDVEHHYTWSDLPKCDDKGNEIKYVVIEEGLEGYFTSYDNGSGGSDSYAGNGGVIVNRVAFGFFTITKNVVNNASGALPADAAFNFTVTPGEKNPGKCELSKLVDPDTGIEEPLTPDEKGIYTVTFVPDEVRSFYVYFPGVAGTYTFDVQEVVPSSLTGIWGYDTHIYTVTFTVNADGTVTKTESGAYDSQFYNDFYGNTELVITKCWDNDSEATRPVTPETFAQYLTLRYAEYPLDTEGDPVYDHEFSANEWKEYTATPSVVEDDEYENEWVITYENLPNCIGGKEVTWSVVEKDIPGYTKEYDEDSNAQWAEKDITNTFVDTPVVITKFWIDENGYVKAENAPNIADKLTLCKLVNGEPKPVENAELPEYTFGEGELGGVYTWSGLPKYDENGNAIEYVVVEQKMEGYEQIYFGADGRPIDGGTYAPKGGSIENEKVLTSVTVTKEWVGGNLQDSDLTNNLTLYADGQPQTAKPTRDGNVYTWEDLPEYSDEGDLIVYTVKETKVPDDYTATYLNEVGEDVGVMVEGDAAFDGGKIVNTYNTEAYISVGYIELEGTKVLNGRDMKAGEFTFILTDKDGNALQSVTNAADGSFAFDAIEFTELDVPYGKKAEFTYYITELAGDLPGVTYDNTQYVIELLLTDNKAGQIIVEPVGGSLPEIKFVNTYEEKVYVAEGEVEFDGVKVLNGRDMKAGEFTFILTDKAGKELQRVTNAADGTFAFEPIKYTEKDVPYGKDAEFTYYITELAGDLPGVTYDTTKYEIVVGLWDDEKGTIHVGDISECVNEIVFTNTYEEKVYEAKGSIVLEGTKVLEGRTLAAGEFSFELKDANGNVLQTVTNDKDGNIVFKTIEYTEADLSKSPIKYTISEVKDSEIGMTYAANVAEVTVTLTDNGDGTIRAEADLTKEEITFVNTYEEKVYEAKGNIVLEGTKVLEGRTLKAGEFSFELKDAADKVVATGTNDVAGKITFTEIKYTEKDAGKTYTYKVYEVKGDLPGVTYVEEPVTVKVTVTDNGDGTLTAALTKDSPVISFKNTYEAEGAVTFKGAKFLMGREFKQGDEFTFELLNEKGDVIDTVTINPTSGTKADFAFKTIKYELADAGKTYTYTYRVKEKAGTEDGMTYDDTVHTVTVTVSDAGDGSLKVVASDSANKLNFTNTYLAEGSVLFSGTKTMNGKALVGKDFTFVLTDADGKEIETVTNDKDGKIVFSTIQYDLEDVGKTFTYKVSEKNDGKKAVTYDDTVYTVTVKVEDAGNGHLKVTASDNATKLNFTNSYEAKAYLTLNAFKTVNGYKPTADQVYDFVLLCDDGAEMTAQNKDENIIFGTLTFNEDDIGKTFIYTVKETTEANELLEVDTAIYQVAVTVADNGDGNLKLETEFLKDGKRANGVVFANTATATLAISKTVKGPGPDKAFDLKVTFIGVDGKELEGVYDYDGDVKGTITSGGVIALKDGQRVTIVGLPEGATYTVEENAGPAYTVTVNGKPIAKAEGTLVGHGKLEFINTVETTTFSVTKVWEGMDLGEITLTLYADGKQITPQPEVTREGNKYTYYNLPKYNEEGEEIVYSAKERGIDGYIRIYNNVEPYQDVTSVVHDGGTIINREIQEEVHELSFKIRKVWTGVEATEEIPAITLTLYCNGEKLDVPTPKPNSEGWYKYYDLPKTVNGQIAVYTVVEEPIPGYTVTYKTASGEIVEEGVNGGEIINAKIPQTGDPATLGLWLALMGASAVLLTMLQRRRKA